MTRTNRVLSRKSQTTKAVFSSKKKGVQGFLGNLETSGYEPNGISLRAMESRSNRQMARGHGNAQDPLEQPALEDGRLEDDQSLQLIGQELVATSDAHEFLVPANVGKGKIEEWGWEEGGKMVWRSKALWIRRLICIPRHGEVDGKHAGDAEGLLKQRELRRLWREEWGPTSRRSYGTSFSSGMVITKWSDWFQRLDGVDRAEYVRSKQQLGRVVVTVGEGESRVVCSTSSASTTWQDRTWTDSELEVVSMEMGTTWATGLNTFADGVAA